MHRNYQHTIAIFRITRVSVRVRARSRLSDRKPDLAGRDAPSIRGFAGCFFPRPKCRQRFLPHHLHHRNLAPRKWLANFFVNRGIVKSDPCRVAGNTGIVNCVNSRPVNGAQAHRARFARRVEFTAAKLEAAKIVASLPNCHHFGMRRGVIRRRDLICSFADYSAFFHDHASERPTTPGTHIFYREFYGPRHENVSCFRHRVIANPRW